jgi:RNA polymerase sigma-70 factor, ECF subfamily
MTAPENSDTATAKNRDDALIKSALNGDTRAFAQLMSLYKRRVQMLGMSFFKNISDSEDFVQEVFLKVYTRLSTFQGTALFSTWITRIAYNIAINSVNRRKEYLPIMDETVFPDPGFSPEEKEIRQITIEAVRAAIKELPERYAVCLDMYFFYDMSYQEISDTTGYPVNTIKSHIFRAKKILRDKLEHLAVL